MQIATNPTETIIAFREEAIANLIRNGVLHDATDANKLRDIPIDINARLRITNGQCTWKNIPGSHQAIDLKVTFALDYMHRAEEQFVRNTVSHEYAHAYQVIRTGTSGHDRMWRMFHRAMGGNGETHTNHNTPGKRNTVQRVVVCDTTTNKELRITVGNWKRVQSCARASVRYTFVRQFALQR